MDMHKNRKNVFFIENMPNWQFVMKKIYIFLQATVLNYIFIYVQIKN